MNTVKIVDTARAVAPKTCPKHSGPQDLKNERAAPERKKHRATGTTVYPNPRLGGHTTINRPSFILS